MNNMGKELIIAKNISPMDEVSEKYPTLDLQLGESSMLSFLGLDQADRTLWFKTLNGLHPIAQGELNFMQHDVRHLSREDWLHLKKDIAYLAQDTVLLSAYTLLENILLPGLYHKVASRKQLVKRAYELLEEIGFDEFDCVNKLPAYATALQNYYAKIVRTLIVQPKLLFLDDPYAYISVDRANDLKTFFKNKVKNMGLSVVLAARHVNQVLDESSNIVFISQQKVCVFNCKSEFLISNNELVKQYLIKNEVH